MLLDKFQVDASYFEVEDSEFGKKLKSGHWSGVVGEVLKRGADLGMGKMIFTHARHESVSRFYESFKICIHFSYL